MQAYRRGVLAVSQDSAERSFNMHSGGQRAMADFFASVQRWLATSQHAPRLPSGRPAGPPSTRWPPAASATRHAAPAIARGPPTAARTRHWQTPHGAGRLRHPRRQTLACWGAARPPARLLHNEGVGIHWSALAQAGLPCAVRMRRWQAPQGAGLCLCPTLAIRRFARGPCGCKILA